MKLLDFAGSFNAAADREIEEVDLRRARIEELERLIAEVEEEISILEHQRMDYIAQRSGHISLVRS